MSIAHVKSPGHALRPKHSLPLWLVLALLPGCRAQTPPPPVLPVTPPPLPLWTDAERAACVAFWDTAGRRHIEFDPARVVLTPEASLWFAAYNRARRTATPEDAAAWKTWVDARFACDHWDAAQVARTAPDGPAPDPPGVIPAGLLLAAGDPPPLAEAVTPKRFTIALGGDDPPLTYDAPIAISARYPSYRFADGVISGGVPLKTLPTAEIDALMQAAGLTPTEAHFIGAVSRLEGGFDAVNTYDTGFVSVGFIQFITGGVGTGSLAAVLASEKADQPAAFLRDFHSRGIDVTLSHVYAVVDPATGAELTGADAVRKTVHDPRLVAVFQAAGRRSVAFRVAQIKVAKQNYDPALDPITVALPDGTVLTGRVGDVLTSEAGLATAFDRKVNTGHAAPEVAAAVASVMTAHHLAKISDVAPYEREVISALRYRADFLSDSTLTQPPSPPAAAPPGLGDH